jgi:glycosyltransferase involved in cell wall biosynthesis
VRWLTSRRRWDIGIAPLEDTEFNRCKSPLKFFDCCALGLAAVCSDVAPYRGVLRDGVNGLRVADSPQAWHAALARLIEDEPLRDRLALCGREHLRRDYTLRTQSRQWLTAYRQLAFGTGRAEKVEAIAPAAL